MIQESSLCNAYFRTAGRRRAMVIGFYLVVLAITAFHLYRHKFVIQGLWVQTLILGGIFGGISRGGPIKPYGNMPLVADPDRDMAASLSITGKRTPFDSVLLDERETGQRDRAHYTAFIILRWTLGCSALLFWICFNLAPNVASSNAPTLLWALVVFVLSLPQSVILWTEPTAVPDTVPTLAQQA